MKHSFFSQKMLLNKYIYQQKIINLPGRLFACCTRSNEKVSLLTFYAVRNSMLKAVRDSQARALT